MASVLRSVIISVHCYQGRPKSKIRPDKKSITKQFDSRFKKLVKKLNFSTIDQSAALIQLGSQSEIGKLLAGNISILDLTVKDLAYYF